jgi:hypothetical protein
VKRQEQIREINFKLYKMSRILTYHNSDVFNQNQTSKRRVNVYKETNRK